MALQIIDADQPIEVEAIISVLFGMPDAGKTSLSFTAEEPFLLDFDEGLQRSVKRKKSARVMQWEDVVEFYQGPQFDQMNIGTLIIDTAGTMLDNFVAQAVIRSDSKNAKKDGSLGLSGYGAMKNVFNTFVNAMKAKKIDVIFICHDTEQDEDGYSRKVPKVTGGSYDILKSKADIMGYLYIQNEKRWLDFNRTDFHDGKNCAEFKKMEVPHYTDPSYDGFFARVIKQTKDKMNAFSEEMVEAQKKVDEYREYISNSKNYEELGMIYDDIEKGLSTNYQLQVFKVYENKFIEFLTFDLSQVETPENMDAIFAFATQQPKRFVSAMKKAINERMEELGFKYNKDTNHVEKLPNDGKKDEKSATNTQPSGDKNQVQDIADSQENKKTGVQTGAEPNKQKARTTKTTTKKEAEEQSLKI